ncbi:MAG: hypothetical protein U0520_03465 [Candidatus Saccharimonadales bacterium]|jgi:hypothetical protein
MNKLVVLLLVIAASINIALAISGASYWNLIAAVLFAGSAFAIYKSLRSK